MVRETREPADKEPKWGTRNCTRTTLVVQKKARSKISRTDNMNGFAVVKA